MKKTKNSLKYPVKRIPEKTIRKLEFIGEGNWRHGLDKVLNIYDMVERDPAIILNKELEHFGNLFHTFLPENHYEHYLNSNLSALLRVFIKTGRLDVSILNSRIEKTLDNFEKSKEKKLEEKNIKNGSKESV